MRLAPADINSKVLTKIVRSTSGLSKYSKHTTYATSFTTVAETPQTPAKRSQKSERKWDFRFRPSTCQRPSTTTSPSLTTALASARSQNMLLSPPERPLLILRRCAPPQLKFLFWRSWVAMQAGLQGPPGSLRDLKLKRLTLFYFRKLPSTNRVSSPRLRIP